MWTHSGAVGVAIRIAIGLALLVVIYGGFAYLMGARPRNQRARKALNRGIAVVLLAVIGLTIWGAVSPTPWPYHGSGRQEHSTDPFATTTTTQP